MTRSTWIVLALLLIVSASCVYALNKLFYYKANYDILRKQQQSYVKQSQYLVKSSNKLTQYIELTHEKMHEVNYEHIGINDKRVTPAYLKWLCHLATCTKQPSPSS